MTEQHRFSRMELLVGDDSLQKLHGSSLAVFGVGGVGSYAVEALVRAGVGRLTLVDFDDICQTNCNRQLHATSETIGRVKVEVMAERCRAINPQVQVEPLQAFYEADTSAELLGRGYDYVLDCIDHITGKLHLIESCKRQDLPIISSMGAANKLDPTKIKVADLFHTEKCRLARIMRKELRRRGIHEGIKVVYSKEEFRPLNDKSTLIDNPNQEKPRQSRNERRVTLGSSSYIPPLFGLTMAGEVIRELLDRDSER
ncbi:MAG: tRNA cyclic N6-threonylcarbamoyladenosine(37) synthase TcdA [Desulfuromonas sp.]|nr:MAG: tRNA cyclic N6-threonylcarbamoyladenosine(37) synthase TcdA [Desulfuromonas sp.]